MNDAEHLAHLEAHVADNASIFARSLGGMATTDLQRILDVMSRDRERLKRRLDGPFSDWDRVRADQARLSWAVGVGYLVGEEILLRESGRATRITGPF